MKYGLLGAKLPYSYSPELHSLLGNYDYSLIETVFDGLKGYLRSEEYGGFNVTMPYKRSIIELLDSVSPLAERIGVVNTVVRQDGKLIGYNTDYYGLSELIDFSGITVADKKIVIFGSGATAKTAVAVMTDKGAREVTIVSRSGNVNYGSDSIKDGEVLINTTPVGTFPDVLSSPVKLRDYLKAEAVADVTYNPFRTALLAEAANCGLKTAGGLYMLCAQAVKTCTLFGFSPNITAAEAYEKLLHSKRNIVLCGMSGTGKTAVGKAVAALLNRPFFDMDEAIQKAEGKPISELFSLYGEGYFRQSECAVAAELAAQRGIVIATGGGAVLNGVSTALLKSCGFMVLLDNGVKDGGLDGRPLTPCEEAWHNLKEQRDVTYNKVCDCVIHNVGTVEEAAAQIVSAFGKAKDSL